MFEQVVLETDHGHSALKDFVKVRLFQDEKPKGPAYGALQGLLFNTNPMPHYFIVNPDGRITAHTTDIGLFGILPKIPAMSENGRELTKEEVLERFLATSKNKGFEFDLVNGFKAPATEADKETETLPSVSAAIN